MRILSQTQRNTLCFGFVLASLALSGCSICAPGFIDDYATVGGKWNRSDPTHGRVGSPFSDPVSGIGSPESIFVEGEQYEEQYMDGEYEMGVEYESGGIEYYDDGSMNGEFNAYPSDGSIEIVPQYEEGSIILGDGW
jgi:hypothetical protein